MKLKDIKIGDIVAYRSRRRIFKGTVTQVGVSSFGIKVGNTSLNTYVNIEYKVLDFFGGSAPIEMKRAVPPNLLTLWDEHEKKIKEKEEEYKKKEEYDKLTRKSRVEVNTNRQASLPIELASLVQVDSYSGQISLTVHLETFLQAIIDLKKKG